MRSRIFTISCLFCVIFLLVSCKKDKDPVEESPFFEFFNEPSIIIDTTDQAADTWEYGFAFTPLTDGKITKLGIKLPTTGDYTVTLWDISGNSPVVLRESTV